MDTNTTELDSQWGVDDDTNTGRGDGRRGNSLVRFLVATTSQQLPRQYFKLRIRRDPVAPISSLLWGYSFEVILSTAALAVLLWYYASNGGAPFPLTTEIVNTVKEAGTGWTCKVLSPKKGTVYYSTLNSENAQFASPYENYLDVAECKATLTKHGVCNDGLRYDHLSVLGVTNTNNSQYYTSGYFSFTPTQTQGLSTDLTSFFGKSVAFPQPSVVGQSFPGTETTLYVYDFLRNTAANAFSSYPGVHVSSVLRDPVTNQVYDPAKGSTSRDFDLSSSSAGPVDSSGNKVQALQGALGLSTTFGIVDIGVFNGVYYGIKYESLFNTPTGVDVSSQCLADSGGNLYMFDYYKVYVSDHTTVSRIGSDSGMKEIQATTSITTGYDSVAVMDFTSCPAPSPSTLLLIASIGTTVDTIQPTAAAATATLNKNPLRLAVDRLGNTWIAQDGNYGSNDGIQRIASGSTSPTTVALTATTPNYPVANIRAWGIAVHVDTTTTPTEFYVYVSDYGHHTVLQIIVTLTGSSLNGKVTDIGSLASPNFFGPSGVAIDRKNENVYVCDTGNNLIRRIELSSGVVTTLGDSASPSFNAPKGVAVDYAGNLYVADTANNLVRKVDGQTGEMSTRVGRLVTPTLFSYDTKSSNGWTPLSATETTWGGSVLDQTGLDSISPIDPGGCQNLEAFYLVPQRQGAKPNCFTVVNSEFNAQAGHLYVEFQQFKYIYPRITLDSTRILVLDPTDTSKFLYNFKIAATEPGRQLWGVVKTAKYGVVLFTSAGAVGENPNPGIKVKVTTTSSSNVLTNVDLSDLATKICVTDVAYLSTTPCIQVAGYVTGPGIPDGTTVQGNIPTTPGPGTLQMLNAATATGTVTATFYKAGTGKDDQISMEVIGLSGYNGLVQAEGTTVIDGSVIPGASPRYLLLMLNQKGLVSAFTYDTQTDTYFSNPAAAAPTHYMIAYTYGICSGDVTKGLVELTFSNDYSNQCQLPNTGLYYQSPNQYFPIPYSCLGVPYDKLLTDCPEVKANMKSLVDSTCSASIDKVCTTQYTQNPPFACSKPITPSPLTVISLAGSNTMAVASFVATLVALVLGRRYKNYAPTAEELVLVNGADTIAATTPSEKAYKVAALSVGKGEAELEGVTPSEAVLLGRVEEMGRKIASLEKQLRGGGRGGSVAVHVSD